MDRQLDDITLYPTEADPVLAEEVRRKVGRDYRWGLILWPLAALLAIVYDFIFDKPSLRTVVTVGVPIAWFLLFLHNLRSLNNAPASRVLKVGSRSICDCVSIRSPRDHVVRYRYSAMRGCTITNEGLTIMMADERILEVPVEVFANAYEMKAFARALAEQKNVPVIDLTKREAAGVSR